MLSRAAERIYWTGRYLERAEDTARLVQQYSQLLLDLPPEAGVDWRELVRIVGAARNFAASGRPETEREILEFLLADRDGPSSLAYSLRMARENIRNTRDLLPQESWEFANELYQYANRHLAAAAAGENRFEILSECVVRCQGIIGILHGTMSRHSPYHFQMLGQGLERADMTSRIVDVAAAYIQHNERIVKRYGSSLWTNVLKSVSGFQMYRQFCQPEVEGERVIEFLLLDRAFPRAVAYCVDRCRATCGELPRNDAARAALDAVDALLVPIAPERMTASDVSGLMDTVQQKLGDVHAAIVATWLLPGDA
ncbi:MAG: alpha-E domain-containing protein [Woeseiaceae bacterium]|nr:alpha-E domain-containing protein [Woeseiaceae bacterium]